MSAASPSRRFKAGEVLFREGEAGQHLYVLQRGSVRLSRTVDGEETTLMDLQPGDFCGESAVVVSKPHTSTATALSDGECISVDSSQLEAMVVGNSEIAVRMIRGLTERLGESYDMLTMLAVRDSRARVCMAIIRHAEASTERTGQGIWIRKRLGDIGEEVAISDAELGEISKQLLRLQLLRIKRDGILVPDVSRLYGYVKSND